MNTYRLLLPIVYFLCILIIFISCKDDEIMPATSPLPALPEIPQNVSASPGNGEVTISWESVDGAIQYNVYWSGSSGVNISNSALIPNVTSPFLHTDLKFETTYYYIVAAVNEAGVGAPSSEVSATTKPSVIQFLSQTITPGSLTADVWGFETGGKEYAIIGDDQFANNGRGDITFIDVTDPVNPTIVSQVGNINGFDMKVWGNYLYVANGGIGSIDDFSSILDISDIQNPVVASSFISAHNIWIDKLGFLYTTGGEEGIQIFNLNPNPLTPLLVWKNNTGGFGHDIAVIRDRLYDFHGYSGTYIYNVSSRLNPFQISFIPFPGFNHNGWVTEDDNFLFITEEIEGEGIGIYDISNLSQPVKVGGINLLTIPHNIYIINDIAYISHYESGFVVYDVSNPIEPKLLGRFDTNINNGSGFSGGFAGAWGVYPFATSGNIYVSDIDNDLFVFTLDLIP